MNKYFSFVLLLLLFASCKNNKIDTSEFRTIALAAVEEALPLDSIFDSYDIFQVKDSIFGYIQSITEIGDKLLLKVQHDKYGFLLFDPESGKFKAIAIKGRGPGEFWTVGYPEPKENGFFIPDRMNKRVSEYNTQGEIVRVIEVPLLFDEVIMKDYPLVYTYKSLGDTDEKTKDYEIVLTNLEDQSTIHENLLIDNDVAIERGIAGGRSFSTIDNSVVFCQPLYDTVYSVNKEGIFPEYVFDTNGRSISQDDLNNADIGLVEFFDGIYDSDYIWFYIDYMENERYIYFTFTCDKLRYFTFYNKVSLIGSTSNRIIDNIVFGKQFTYGVFTPVGMGNNCMYFSIDPIAVLNNESIPGLDLQPEILKSLKEDDNKLIVKLNFK